MAVVPEEEGAALPRGDDRDSLFLQAGLLIPGSPDPVVVRVRNLSAGGMLAESPAPVTEGTALAVELGNTGTVSGRVVWAGEGKFGIAFDRQINPQAARRQVVRESDLPAYLRRSGLEPVPIYRRR